MTGTFSRRASPARLASRRRAAPGRLKRRAASASPRSRNAARWLRARLVPAVLLVSLTYVVGVALWSPAFTVADVRPIGAPPPLAQEVRRVAGAAGVNVFALQTASVRAAILALPDVREVRVVPALPNRVDLRVVPYVPAAVWRSGSMPYLVTADGFVIKPVSGAAIPAGLVVVDDSRPLRLAHGDHVDAASIAGAIRLREILASRGVDAVRMVSVPDATIEVDGAPGWQALFNLRDDLATQADVLAEVLNRKMAFQVLDLRAGASPYYR